MKAIWSRVNNPVVQAVESVVEKKKVRPKNFASPVREKEGI
jgi:hypothetical protein